MPLAGPIFRITLAAVLTTAATAQTKPSTQKKSEAALRSATHAAQVTYTGGQLSVVANNNSLAETLAEIRNLTKAKVEGVQPGVAERVSGEFGPDTPRAVVGALLATSHYNFILVSPPGNPGSLQRIVLSEPTLEPVVAARPVAQPSMQAASPQPAAQLAAPPQPGALEKPSADVPAEGDRQPDGGAKDEPQHLDSAGAAKEASDATAGTESSNEPKPDSDTPVASSQPNRANNENQPSVPPTVVICGVTYDASQLVDLKVPDHCGKPAQQPNPSNGSK